MYICITTTNKNIAKMKKSSFKIESFNRGTLFAVTDDYNMYGKYYKTTKAAEKKLKEVRLAAGEIQG